MHVTFFNFFYGQLTNKNFSKYIKNIPIQFSILWHNLMNKYISHKYELHIFLWDL